MQIYNLLNTNTTRQPIEKINKNNIEPTHLLNLLNNTKPNKNSPNKNNNKQKELFTNPEYLGQGINGDLFRVKESNSNDKFICKVIPFNKEYLKQLSRELGLLKTIQEHELIHEYINPCKKIFISDNSIVSLFPVFNGITLTNVIEILKRHDFDIKNRILLIKYIVKEILEAIYFFHKLNVSHLQLDTESILIELKQPNESNLSKNEYQPSYNNRYNNDNIPITDKEKFVPTNMKVYSVELYPDQKPLQIKFTNFGIGCGKLTEYDIETGNNLNSSKFQQCNIIRFNKDPYIQKYIQDEKINVNTDQLQNSKQFEIAKHYDSWLIGLIILQLILKPDAYIHFNQSCVDSGYKAIGDLLSQLSGDDLLDESFDLYMDNIKKYVLCPIEQRRNLKFVQEMIILDEKHD
jgi:serine/threonine protein kinase